VENVGYSPKVTDTVAIREEFEPCFIYGVAVAGIRYAVCTYDQHRLNRR
jgi:hypothetical protein